MRTDFEALRDGDRITLFPRPDNPLHSKPVTVIYLSGYFYGDDSDATEGPDYYLGDVLKFNEGFEMWAGK